jgi:hypothetical protein
MKSCLMEIKISYFIIHISYFPKEWALRKSNEEEVLAVIGAGLKGGRQLRTISSFAPLNDSERFKAFGAIERRFRSARVFTKY